MEVRAKMRVTSITKSGDAKKPYVQVALGAVYSNDPESENRSFANATPTAEAKLSIDAGRPAATAFELGAEYYVDFTKVGVPERFYLGDYYQVPHGDYILESRDGSKQLRAKNDGNWIVDGKKLYQKEHYEALGVEFWRHLREGE